MREASRATTTFACICVLASGCLPRGEAAWTTGRATRTPEYQRLSPVAIRKGEVTVEVTALLATSSCLTFGMEVRSVHPTMDPPPPYAADPVAQVRFLAGTGGSPLELSLVGGGGGGFQSAEGILVIDQEFDYHLKTPLSAGKETQVTALVTLHKALGITAPVRFDLRVVPAEGSACLPLPTPTLLSPTAALP